MWLLALCCLGGLGASVAAFAIRTRSSLERRETFSCIPLGVGTRRRRTAKHSILGLQGIQSIDDYLRHVDSRSVKATMKNQIDKAFREHNITCVTKSFESIHWSHFRVIYAHERKVYGAHRAVFASLMRFLALSLMVGTIDEYYAGSELVAFTSTIVKGKTMRAMWFYQRPEHGQHMIWFHSLRVSLQRAIAMQLGHLDLGPSIDDGVARLKEKYGFAYSASWRDECDYEGPFQHTMPVLAPASG